MTMLGTAVAEIESEFHAGYSSDYIFRGTHVGSALFEFGFDFAGDTDALGGLSYSAGVWYASFEGPLGGSGGASGNELDVYAEVSKSLNEMLSVAVGVTNYSYFGAGGGGATNAPDDIEPYIAIGTELSGISLGAAAYHNSSNTLVHDWYYEASAAYEHELSEDMSLGLEALVGYFDESLFTPATPDVDDWYVALTASLSIAVSDNITISPYISQILAENDHTVGGVSVGFGF